MKTIKDAYKELKGDLGGSYEPRDDDKFLFWGVFDGMYVCLPHKSNDKDRQYICTVDEFNNYHSTPERMMEIQTALADSIENKESGMITFDLQAALDGEKVVTRDGREVTQLHLFAVNRAGSGGIAHIYCVIDGENEAYSLKGSYDELGDSISDMDLFMAPKKLSGFVNVYSDGFTSDVYKTKQMAEQWSADSVRVRLVCIDLSKFEEGKSE